MPLNAFLIKSGPADTVAAMFPKKQKLANVFFSLMETHLSGSAAVLL